MGRGVIYVSAAGSSGSFGAKLAAALGLLDPAPNPLLVIYNNVLKLEVGKPACPPVCLPPCLPACPARAASSLTLLSEVTRAGSEVLGGACVSS